MFRIGKLYLILIVVVTLQSCSAHKIVVGDGAGWLGREMKSTDGLQDHDFGFALFDPVGSEWIYDRNSTKYFTPASNAKILTLYTALHYLKDSTEALRFVRKPNVHEGDTLIFWGTGDPSLLYHNWGSEHILDFLRSNDGPLYYAPRAEIEKYGPGWAWDDYPYRFQVEKSTLPVYGNRLTFSRFTLALEGEVSPPYFRQYVVEDAGQNVFARRMPDANSFTINSELVDKLPFEVEIPFIVSSYDVAEILSETLNRKVTLDYNFRQWDTYQVIKGVSLDSLYQLMMRDSDNFIAEQLLLLCANEMNGDFTTQRTIEAAQEDLLSDAPDPFQWFDGSGLSRYNLFTPRSLVWILDQLLKEKGLDYIKEIFAAGGVNGTIEDWYGGSSQPVVFAKTGSLRNRHCLSGYLIAKSGRTLIFSFMHQNFIGSSISVKEGMQHVLRSVYEKY